MKPQIPAAFKVRMWKSEPFANTIPEPTTRVKNAKEQNTTPRMGCLRAGGSFSSRWVVPRMMYNTSKMNKLVATKIRNSNLSLSVLLGKETQMTKVRNVMIASMSLSHPSFVVTIQRQSQQLQLQVRVRVVDVVWSFSILNYGTRVKEGSYVRKPRKPEVGSRQADVGSRMVHPHVRDYMGRNGGLTDWRNDGTEHGRSQDFLKGGSPRLVTRLSCRLLMVYTAALPRVSAGSVVLSRHEGPY